MLYSIIGMTKFVHKPQPKDLPQSIGQAQDYTDASRGLTNLLGHNHSQTPYQIADNGFLQPPSYLYQMLKSIFYIKPMSIKIIDLLCDFIINQ
jgi:hypothetical protein